MQINSIGNHQTNFNGQLVFSNVGTYTKGKGLDPAELKKLSLNSEHIVSIRSNDYNIDCSESFFNKRESGNYFKTIITMITGDHYGVKNDLSDVVQAKRMVDGTSSIIEVDDMLHKIKI